MELQTRAAKRSYKKESDKGIADRSRTKEWLTGVADRSEQLWLQ